MGEIPESHKGHPEVHKRYLVPIGSLSRTSNGPRGACTSYNQPQRHRDGTVVELAEEDRAFLLVVHLEEAEPVDIALDAKFTFIERQMDVVGVRAVAVQAELNAPVVETVVKKPRRKRVPCPACSDVHDNTKQCPSCKGEGTVLQ